MTKGYVDLKQRLASVFGPVMSSRGVSMQVAVLCCVVVVLYMSTVRKRWRGKPAQNLKLPPGPPSLPIIGNFHLLGKMPYRDLGKLADKYGPIMSLKLGSVHTVVISSPELARQILKTQDLAFANRPMFSGSEIINHNASNLAWAPYGPTWRLLKKVCSIELFTVKRIKQFQNIRQQELLIAVQSMVDEGGEGKLVDIAEHMETLTANNITRMLMNKRYFGSKGKPVSSMGEAKEFQHLVRECFRIAGAFVPGDYIPCLQWLDIGGYRAQLKCMKIKLDRFLADIIQEHRQRAENPKLPKTQDFVDVLLTVQKDSSTSKDTLTDLHISQLILDMVLGGTDTSATVITWVMTALMKYPEVGEKLQDELDAVVGRDRLVNESDLPHLKYLQAVVRETMRCYPVGPFLLPRESIVDTKVEGYDIPQKTRILVSLWALHKHEKTWKDPQTFRPERFLPNLVDFRVNSQYGLLPFGGGRRMCPGVSLGLLLVELTVAQLVQTCHFSLPQGLSPTTLDTQEVNGLTLQRATPLKLQVSPRLPSLIS